MILSSPVFQIKCVHKCQSWRSAIKSVTRSVDPPMSVSLFKLDNTMEENEEKEESPLYIAMPCVFVQG